jgi:hypothetical protein
LRATAAAGYAAATVAFVFGLEGDGSGRISCGGGDLFFGLESDGGGRVSYSGRSSVFSGGSRRIRWQR